MSKTFNPGSNCTAEGMYVKIDGQGREINNHFKMKKGEKFPPSQSSNIKYKKI